MAKAKDNWSKINQELQERLKNYKFSFMEAWKLIGCGEKTLRRYMEYEFIMPLKISDEWYLTSDMIDKCKFINQMRCAKRCNVWNANDLYDYMVDKGIRPIYKDIFKDGK